MMVFSHGDGKSEVIEEETIAADRLRGTVEDPAVQRLLRSFESGDEEALLSELFDQRSHYKLRQKAAELIGELGLLEVVEPVRHHKFTDERVRTCVRDTIKRIYEKCHSQECPHCAEVVRADERVCTECGRDLKGL
jgi:hypothetical protein